MNTDIGSRTAQESMSGVRHASDELLQAAGNAVNSTRNFTNDALDKADDKVRGLRNSLDPVVDILATQAQKLARHSLDLASEAKERAEQSFQRAARVTTRYVSDQPLRSVLIAAAVGAAVALLVSYSRNRNHNRY